MVAQSGTRDAKFEQTRIVGAGVASEARQSRAWVVARRPLLLALALGTTLSIAASGRVSVRLVVDGALSFGFVPIIELLAFFLVYRRRARTMSFAPAVDRFFVGNSPWLVALTVVAAITAIDTPQDAMLWTGFPRLAVLVAGAIAAGAWSLYLDVRFSQSTLRSSRSTAIADACLFRAIAWPLATVYFLGYAIWPMLVQWSRAI